MVVSKRGKVRARKAVDEDRQFARVRVRMRMRMSWLYYSSTATATDTYLNTYVLVSVVLKCYHMRLHVVQPFFVSHCDWFPRQWLG